MYSVLTDIYIYRERERERETAWGTKWGTKCKTTEEYMTSKVFLPLNKIKTNISDYSFDEILLY